jgi:hypothetical protein
MTTLRRWLNSRPRSFSAVAFGVSTMIVTHLAWIGSAATSGLAPLLTIAVGFAHAAAGAMTGRRLVDSSRTRSIAGAALMGGSTSLIALALFSPLFATYLYTTDVRPAGAVSYVVLPFFITLFAFLAAGWACMVISMGVGCALHAIAIRPPDNAAHTPP